MEFGKGDFALTISVALCTFNGEKYIKEQLESIINQTRCPDEIIVFDDSSTDSTVSIVKETLKKQNRIPYSIIVNENNVGYIKNFDLASRKCSCDIVFWADQDDIWFRDRIFKMAKPFEDNSDVVYCYSDAIIVDENLKVLDESFIKKWSISLCMFKDHITWGHYPYGCMIAIRSDVLHKCLPFSLPHDFTVAKNVSGFGRIIEINEPLMYYRRHENALTYHINNRKKNDLLIRGFSFWKSIKRVTKKAWFDYSEVSKSVNHFSSIDKLNQCSRDTITLEIRYIDLCNSILKINRFYGIFLLIRGYWNGVYSIRGNKNSLVHDIVYLLFHFE